MHDAPAHVETRQGSDGSHSKFASTQQRLKWLIEWCVAKAHSAPRCEPSRPADSWGLTMTQVIFQRVDGKQQASPVALPRARRRLSALVRQHADHSRAFIVSVHRRQGTPAADPLAVTDISVRLRKTWADPTIGLLVKGETLDGLTRGYPPASGHTKSFFSFNSGRTNVSTLNSNVQSAVSLGTYYASHLLYFFPSLENYVTASGSSAWAARGDLPAALETAIDKLPEGERFAARMLLSSATKYEFGHPLGQKLGSLLGFDEPARRDLWTAAGLL